MADRRRKLLLDVLTAGEAIQGFVAGRDLASFRTDLQLRSAVERQFEIIGEALTRLRRDDPAAVQGISESEKIIGFRNVLAHGYDVIDDGITWDAVQGKLPRLLAEVRALAGP